MGKSTNWRIYFGPTRSHHCHSGRERRVRPRVDIRKVFVLGYVMNAMACKDVVWPRDDDIGRYPRATRGGRRVECAPRVKGTNKLAKKYSFITI